MLPDGYRTVFTLNAFEGYDYDEIAEILSITPSTVRTQYHRAKKQLLLFEGGYDFRSGRLRATCLPLQRPSTRTPSHQSRRAPCRSTLPRHFRDPASLAASSWRPTQRSNG